MVGVQYSLTLFVIGWLALPGCSHLPPKSQYGLSQTGPQLEDTEAVLDVLYDQYERWKGVRYEEGGLSTKGVDCSGFVFITFQRRFGIHLPRATAGQIAVGLKVSPDNLKPGDLLFFRTGTSKRHVGIYMERGFFLHASTSDGVTISSLRNEYWHSSFWMARRPDIRPPAEPS